MAVKRKVFKVETIGDWWVLPYFMDGLLNFPMGLMFVLLNTNSYMACTGLVSPHACSHFQFRRYRSLVNESFVFCSHTRRKIMLFEWWNLQENVCSEWAVCYRIYSIRLDPTHWILPCALAFTGTRSKECDNSWFFCNIDISSGPQFSWKRPNYGRSSSWGQGALSAVWRHW